MRTLPNGRTRGIAGTIACGILASAVTFFGGNVVALAQPTIIDLGPVPNTSIDGWPYAINDNGSVVAGGPWPFATNPPAFVWTPSAGTIALSALSGDTVTRAFGLSADGTVVVGSSRPASPQAVERGVIWSSPTTPHELGTLRSSPMIPSCISGNGLVAAGAVASGVRMFRWSWATPGGPGVAEELPLPPPMPTVSAPRPRGISHDGSVIVGQWRNETAGQLRTFRWTPATGAQELAVNDPLLTTGAIGVSSQGDVIVGTMSRAGRIEGSPDSSDRAFRWTAAEGFVSLGIVPGDTYSRAVGVSGNGSRVIAMSGSLGRFGPAIWTQRDGMVALSTLLAETGTDLTGWVLTEVTAISADASTIAGVGTKDGVFRTWVVRGFRSSACLADLDRSGDITPMDIFVFVNAWYARDPLADYNNSGAISPSDLFDYLDAWFAGC